MVLRCLLGVVAAALVGCAAAQEVTFPTRPTKGAVADEAQVITKEHRAKIDKISAEAAAQSGSLIVVAVVKSQKAHHAGYLTVEQYARLLFDKWGPGSQTNNKGMLLFVSIEDRKARIEVGGGWMGQINSDAQRVMDQAIVPEFKQKRYSEGILAGVKGLQAIRASVSQPIRSTPYRAEPYPYSASPQPIFPSSDGAGGAGLLACCFAPVAVIARLLGGGGRGGWGGGNGSTFWNSGGGFSSGGGGGFSGGGGSSGGGGFSGGSGGGGGASGSW